MSSPSIVLITGGNTGIGYETVKALYASPSSHTILMGSRSLAKAADAISTLQAEITSTKSSIEPVQIDIEDDESIQAAFEYVEKKYKRIDALVNNAGTYYYPTFSTNTPSGNRFNLIVDILSRRCIRHPPPHIQLHPYTSPRLERRILSQRNIHPSLHLHIHAPPPLFLQPAPTFRNIRSLFPVQLRRRVKLQSACDRQRAEGVAQAA
jgi:NAD(P)-dependent dehydrogenase (short-subunit alcohol dehydrogenase family)